MKKILIIIFCYIPAILFSQIKIDDIGDDWKHKVEVSLEIIKNNDRPKYDTLLKYCNYITFWSGNFSTTEDKTTIMISQKDMTSNSPNNISCVIVHESFHLKNYGKNLNPNFEEYCAYDYELDFLKKLDGAEQWLFKHIDKMKSYYGQ